MSNNINYLTDLLDSPQQDLLQLLTAGVIKDFLKLAASSGKRVQGLKDREEYEQLFGSDPDRLYILLDEHDRVREESILDIAYYLCQESPAARMYLQAITANSDN